MEEQTSYTQTVGVVAETGSEHSQGPGLIDVSGPMMLLTWATFIILAFILGKVAWKPILKGLEVREESIRKALDEAEKARAELAAVEARTKQMIAEAQEKGESIVASARISATELANTIEKRAKDRATGLVDDAQREISSATDKARILLRAESADLAIMLAGRVIGESMDSEKNRAMVNRLVSEN